MLLCSQATSRLRYRMLMQAQQRTAEASDHNKAALITSSTAASYRA